MPKHPLLSLPPMPPSLGLGHPGLPKESICPHAIPSTEQGDMTIDYAPPTAPILPPTMYLPPDTAHVLQPLDGGFPTVYGLEQGLLSFVHNNSINLCNIICAHFLIWQLI